MLAARVCAHGVCTGAVSYLAVVHLGYTEQGTEFLEHEWGDIMSTMSVESRQAMLDAAWGAAGSATERRCSSGPFQAGDVQFHDPSHIHRGPQPAPADPSASRHACVALRRNCSQCGMRVRRHHLPACVQGEGRNPPRHAPSHHLPGDVLRRAQVRHGSGVQGNLPPLVVEEWNEQGQRTGAGAKADTVCTQAEDAGGGEGIELAPRVQGWSAIARTVHSWMYIAPRLHLFYLRKRKCGG